VPIILPATLTTAAACAVLSLWLALRISRWRVRDRVIHGDGGDPGRAAQVRAHANFAEYAPITLVLIAGIELARGPSPALWVLAAVFVAGRILHPFGMDRPAPNALRMAGILATWIVLALLAGWAITIAYGLGVEPANRPIAIEAPVPGA
jgi:uncharacterized protein